MPEKVKELMAAAEYKAVAAEVEPFVQNMLSGYCPASPGKGKTIHDPVWGSINYSEWEMQIIDSPLFQRLRDIHQVGLAMLTYPSATHSRLEHSLGVASASKKMCKRINENSTDDFSIDDSHRNCIILAALLHDIGHCFYSHLSETIYGELTLFVNLRRQFNSILSRKPKAHEMLSFIIVNTDAFGSFFQRSVNYPNKENCNDLFCHVGMMIVGYNIVSRDDKNVCINESYQTAIINGSFDADKLDYIKRDSLAAGLALEYDTERFFTKLFVHTIKTDKEIEHRLVIRFNGVTAVEELTFCKIMLFSYIYYHQKVLISENMIKDYVRGLLQTKKIKSVSDFLKYTDSDILRLDDVNTCDFNGYGKINLRELALNIKHRILPKRCYEVRCDSNHLSQHCYDTEIRNFKQSFKEKDYTDEEFVYAVNALSSKLMSGNKEKLTGHIKRFQDMTFDDALKERKNLFDLISAEYTKQNKAVSFTLFDLYLVFPKMVDYGSGAEKVIFRDDEELMTVNDFVKLDSWADSFNSNKWRGYIFTSDKIDRSIAKFVCEKYIFENFDK